MGKREGVSKRIRFEVFKRDSFTCQYCGAKSPDIILCVDHIEPVKHGGTNDILNLVTSCEDCNSGKGAVRLSDESVVAKSRKQAEALQTKREQIEMIAAWHRELCEQENLAANAVADFIPGPWSPNDHGSKNLNKWIRKFGLSEIIDSTKIAFSSYYKDDQPTWERAFKMIPRIAHVRQLQKTDPALAEAHRLRGILGYSLRDRYFDYARALNLLAILIDEGDSEEAERICRNAKNWAGFVSEATGRIDRLRESRQARGDNQDA